MTARGRQSLRLRRQAADRAAYRRSAHVRRTLRRTRLLIATTALVLPLLAALATGGTP